MSSAHGAERLTQTHTQTCCFIKKKTNEKKKHLTKHVCNNNDDFLMKLSFYRHIDRISKTHTKNFIYHELNDEAYTKFIGREAQFIVSLLKFKQCD